MTIFTIVYDIMGITGGEIYLRFNAGATATFNSGYENYFKVHIGDKLFKFLINYEGLYLIEPDKTYFRKVSEDRKSNIIEGLKNCKPWGKTIRVLANFSTRKHSWQ